MELRSQGATIVAQAGEPGPFDIVKKTIKALPSGTRMERFGLFLKEMNGFKDYQRAVNLYFFVNMHDYLTTSRTRQSAAKDRAPKRQFVDSAIEEIKGNVLRLSLDFVLGDKLLRDYTGTEAAKAGGWLAKIGKKAGKKLIGDVFKTDAALRAALK